MQIINVAPKDVYVTMEFSLEELKRVLQALDHTEIAYHGEKEPDMEHAAMDLKRFYEMVSKVVKELEDVKGSIL